MVLSKRVILRIGIVSVVGCVVAVSSAFAAARERDASPPRVTWQEQSPALTPPVRADASAAFDAATGNVVLFGGLQQETGTGSPLNDTWTWDGTTWMQQHPSDSPSPRGDATMAYDTATNTVVLFGGDANGIPQGDTWTWNGTTWTQQHPATSPPARLGAAMVDDAALGKVILFGGNTLDSYLNDTWAWDGTTWTKLSPPDAPTPRTDMSMAYDAATQNVVLFGGTTGAPSPLPTPVPTVVGTPTPAPPSQAVNDTWLFDGQNWIQQFPATSPSPRDGAVFVYDAAIQRAVLFGGYGYCCGDLNDTWIWNGRTWVAPILATSPGARDGAAAADDGANQSITLFGGHSSEPPDEGFLDDTWTLTTAAPGAIRPRAFFPDIAQ